MCLRGGSRFNVLKVIIDEPHSTCAKCSILYMEDCVMPNENFAPNYWRVYRVNIMRGLLRIPAMAEHFGSRVSALA